MAGGEESGAFSEAQLNMISKLTQMSLPEAYTILGLKWVRGRDGLLEAKGAYKKLALKHHPDRSQDVEFFRSVGAAYYRISKNQSPKPSDLTKDSLVDLFNAAFSLAEDTSSGSEDEDSSGCENMDHATFSFPTRTRLPPNFSVEVMTEKQLRNRWLDISDYMPETVLTAEEVEQNATDLITEEQREKQKAEKKKEKRKKYKERKKLEKQEVADKETPSSDVMHNGTPNGNPSSSTKNGEKVIAQTNGKIAQTNGKIAQTNGKIGSAKKEELAQPTTNGSTNTTSGKDKAVKVAPQAKGSKVAAPKTKASSSNDKPSTPVKNKKPSSVSQQPKAKTKPVAPPSPTKKKKNRPAEDTELLAKAAAKISLSQSIDSDEDGDFDEEAAFFKPVMNKARKGAPQTFHAKTAPVPTQVKQATGTVATNGFDKKHQQVFVPVKDSPSKTSKEYALEGNEYAGLNQYEKAVESFTKAIRLNPEDYRYFGNRSYCYDRQEQYQLALFDAEKSILLDTSWSKGYFRKGRALVGLGRFDEADAAFSEVIRIEPSSEEAQKELLALRQRRLVEMGFSADKARHALAMHKSALQPAINSLLSMTDGLDSHNEIYLSEGEEEIVFGHQPVPPRFKRAPPAQQPHQAVSAHQQNYTKSKTPVVGYSSLWIGNFSGEVTDKELVKIFSRFGPVENVRTMKAKFCAFVNFKDTVSAGRAMAGLNEVLNLGGRKMYLRFPDNAFTDVATGTYVTKKETANRMSPTITETEQHKVPSPDTKYVGSGAARPPNKAAADTECYFYRTTGCNREDCRFKHVRANRGIDLNKPGN